MTTTLDGGTSWQVESENLHSGSVATQQHRDVTGNHQLATAHAHINLPNSGDGHVTMQNSDLLDDRAFSRAEIDNGESASHRTAAGRVQGAEEKLGRTSVERSSSSLSKKFNYPLPPPPPPPPEAVQVGVLSLNQVKEDELPPPPPLPPKTGTPNTPNATSDSGNEIPASVQDLRIAACKLREQSANLSESEASIPELAIKKPRTPSQHEQAGQQMIAAGFYSVPSKPPVPPPDMDSIQQALDELDRAAESLTKISSKGVDWKSRDAFSSGDDLRSRHRAQNHTPPFPPVPTSVDDSYLNHGVVECDAFSSFASEMEASFNRIQQSFSSNQLADEPYELTKRPFVCSAGLLSNGEPRFNKNTSPFKNVHTRTAWRSGQYVNGQYRNRKDSGEVVDL